jgi:hypothetical protein
MTESPDALRHRLIASFEAIGDPEERLREVETFDAQIKVDIKELKARIARQLKADDRTWPQVGAVFGVSGARAEQISRAAR